MGNFNSKGERYQMYLDKIKEKELQKSWIKNSTKQIIEKTLENNNYEWFKPVEINLCGENKTIYIGENYLKQDIENWKVLALKSWINFMLDSQIDFQIIEFLNWDNKWNQILKMEKIIEILEERWLRLPTRHEFIAVIESIWVDWIIKWFPGFYDIVNKKLENVWEFTIFPTSDEWYDHKLWTNWFIWILLARWEIGYEIIYSCDLHMLPVIYVKD